MSRVNFDVKVLNYCMKKYYILFCLSILFCSFASAQVKVGANILPGLSVNRISSENDTLSFSNDGLGYRIALGILLDFETRKNYYFSSGLYWFPKRVGIRAIHEDSTSEQSFKLQYLHIPFNFKVLTDEFSIDKWFFFQFGLAFEMKIDESGRNMESVYIEKFNFWDIILDFGIGVEMKLGQNTAFIAGITYYRGLLNAINPQPVMEDDLTLKNDYWALNLGIKF